MTTAQHETGENVDAVATGQPGPLLAVYAHPDDETLQAGGLLARAAAQGRRVVVVTATRGERGEMIGAREVEGTELVAEIRGREISDALAALGVHEHHWLDDLAGDGARWTDSGMAWLAPGKAGPAADAPASALSLGNLPEQAAALAALVRELRPTLVLCDEPGGAYGHPDHVRTHEITTAAVELAAFDTADADTADAETADDGAAGWQVPALGWVVQEEGRLRAARTAVAQRLAHDGVVNRLGAPFQVAHERPSIARAAADVTVEIDVTGVLPRVLIALRSYESQVQGASIPVLEAGARGRTRLEVGQAAVGWYALSNDVAEPVLPVVALELGRGDVTAAGLQSLPSASVVGAGSSAVGTTTAMPGTGVLALRGGLGLLLGLVAATAGTMVHRARLWDVPWGLALGFVLVVLGALLMRSTAKGAGLLGYGLGVLAAVQYLAFLSGDLDMVVAGDSLGTAWLLLSVAAVGVAAFLPRRWVGER